MPEFRDKAYKEQNAEKWERILLRHQDWLQSANLGKGERLEINGKDLRKVEFGKHTLEKAIFVKCLFADRTIWPASLETCQFKGCDLSNATFEGVNLRDAVFTRDNDEETDWTDLSHVTFRNCDMRGARIVHARLNHAKFEKGTYFDDNDPKPKHVKFSLCKGKATCFRDINLKHIVITDSKFVDSFFDSSILDHANIANTDFVLTNFSNVKLRHATINGGSFKECEFKHAIFDNAKLKTKELWECDLTESSWAMTEFSNCAVDGSTFSKCKNLTGAYSATLHAIHGAERAKYSFRWDILPWSKIRFIGTIRLFSVSYFAIIAIVLYAGIASWYHQQLVSLRENHGLVEQFPFFSHLKSLPIPSNAWMIFGALLFLAFAETIYRFRCPTIIKEHTATHWQFIAKREALEYQINTWSNIWARGFSSFFYCLGGGYLFVKLALNTCQALHFLYDNG